MPDTPTAEARSDAERPLSPAWVGVAAGLAALAGALAASRPDLLDVGLVLSPRGFAGVAAAVVLAALALRHPGAGLVLLSLFVYLNLSQVLARFHAFPSVLRLITLPLLAGALAHREPRALRRLFGSAPALLLVVYASIQLASSLYAADTGLSDQRLLETLKGLVIFCGAAALASSMPAVRRGALTLAACAALLGGLATIQVVTGDVRSEFGGLARIKYAHIFGSVFEPRVAGPLGDPNYFAQILVMALPLALALAWQARTLRRRAVGALACLLIVSGTVLTYSRGGAMALAVVGGLSLWAHGVALRRMMLPAAAVAVTLLLLPSGFEQRLLTLEQILPGDEALRPDSSFQKRRLLVEAAWRMFLDHPLRGVGIGNYTLQFEDYASEVGSAARDYEEPDAKHFAHSLYLEVAAETGIVGLAAFAALIWAGLAAARGARQRASQAGRESEARLARGFELAILGYLMSSLFLHSEFQRYLWLYLGYATGLGAMSFPTSDESDAGR